MKMNQYVPAGDVRDLVNRWRLLTAVENHNRFADELEALLDKQTLDELSDNWTSDALIGRVVVSQPTGQKVQIVQFDSSNGIVTGWNPITKEMKKEPLGDLELSDDDEQVVDGMLILE